MMAGWLVRTYPPSPECDPITGQVYTWKSPAPATLRPDDDPGVLDPLHVAGNLSACGTWLEFRRYQRLALTRLHSARFCQRDKLCPLCAIRRGAKRLRRYVARVRQVLADRPDLMCCMATHTIANRPGLDEAFAHLHRGLKLSRERRRNSHRRGVGAWQPAAGVAYSIEIKRGRGSGLWHPHCHGVWLLPRSTDLGDLREQLCTEWRDVTGDSDQVDLRPFHYHTAGIDPTPDAIASDLVEVFKYALKFADMAPADTWHAAQTIRGRRLVGSLGLLYGVSEPDDLLDEPVTDDEPFISLLYRHTGGWNAQYLRTDQTPVPDSA
jgi:hypothetical protein